MLSQNIFLGIINKSVPAKILHEDDHCIAFHDITPQAPVHVLIIPRKVIRTHQDLNAEDTFLLGHMNLIAARLAQNLGLRSGYRLVINCESEGGQTVPHLHMHLLGGRQMTWPPG